ncbi:MAG: hypothetical protein ACYDAQ_20220 [Mycobacteriales bacterium]
MREHEPWLGQGDIFLEAPVLAASLGADGLLRFSAEIGPALLLTHDCVLDKPPFAGGAPRTERLQFARLRAAESLPPNRRDTLRGMATKPEPVEALWLGDLLDLGPSFILLSDPYFVPVGYFQPYLEDYSRHEHARPGDAKRYLTPAVNDTRIGRLDESQLVLLQRKMMIFWTRAEPAELPAGPVPS